MSPAPQAASIHRMKNWKRWLNTGHFESTELEETKNELANTKRQLRGVRRRLKKVARDYLLLKMPHNSVCVEIGVDEGDFSQQILGATNARELHLIDPWEDQGECRDSCYGGLGAEGQFSMDRKYQKVEERFSTEAKDKQVVLHRLTSDEAAPLFEDGYFDWLYLDANHLYEFVKQDLELFYPKIKLGGYVCGDDYGVKGWWQNGVTRAVNEFVEEKALQLEVKATQFIIQKGVSVAYPGQPTSEISNSPLNLREKSRTRHSFGGSRTGSLPDVMIIGTQKGGTTYLYDGVLRKHSHFKAAAKKEIHYFDTLKFKNGIEWYRSNFPLTSTRYGQETITGEASPYYMFHPLAAKRAANTVPQAKLIVLLRNPIDRAFSDYQHKVRSGIERLNFEKAIAAEEERLQGEKEKMLADEDYISRNYRRYAYLARGIYVDQIAEWHKYFAEDQVLILKSEELFKHPDRSVKRVIDFLGLPEQEMDLERILNEGIYSPMSADLRKRLEEYFEPHNRRLYEYLGMDFGW